MYNEEFMRLALTHAKTAGQSGEIPVGCVIVKDGKVIAEAMNGNEACKNPLCHAEINALNKAFDRILDRHLTGCELYVTLEPCPMCAGAIVNSKIDRVYFGAYDEKYGSAGTAINLFGLNGCFHPEVSGGHLEKESRELLSGFFESLRKKKSEERKNTVKTISMIVARGKNGEIGGDNKLLWHISADLKFFKGTTMGKSVIMGRKTFESLPKALPGRKNIVITNNSEYDAPGAVVVHSPEDAVAQADTPEVFIIGGQSVYAAFLPLAQNIYITEVDIEKPEADAFFPDFNTGDFDATTLGEGSENGLSYKHILYTRRNEK